MAWAMRDLDPSTRERVGQRHCVVACKKWRPCVGSLSAARQKLKRVVSSDPLDEVALTQALVNLRDVSQRYQLQLHNIALDVLPELSS